MFPLLFGATTTLMGFFGTPAFADIVITPVVIEQTYCSCVSYLREFIPSTPHVDAVWYTNFPRVTPAVGEVVMFNYDGVYHVAYVSELQEDGFIIHEANFHKCEKDTRIIKWNDPHLIGFWAAS